MGHNDDLQKIKKLIDLMKENELVEIELESGEEKIVLKRSTPQQAAAPAVVHVPAPNSSPAAAPAAQPQAAPVSESEDDGLVEIKSPMVGTFYATPSPDSEPYVEVGSAVSSQTVVCIVEAMKVMNEIKAETAGTIAQVLVKSGQAVEYGQVLFKVKPD